MEEKKDHFRLTELPALPFGRIVNHLQRVEPKAIRNLAWTSREMHANTFFTGKLMRNALCFRAENAWKHSDRARSILENVIARANDKKNHLTSKDRLAVIKSIQIWRYITLRSAQGLLEMVKGLRPKHWCEAVSHAKNILNRGFGQDDNKNFFDRLATLAQSELAKPTQTDQDKAWGLSLLEKLALIPENPAEERITRFDQLASLWETMEDDWERAKGLEHICRGISHLSPAAAGKRLEKYAGLASSLTDDDAKEQAFDLLAEQMLNVPEAARWGTFEKLAALAHSIYDAAIREEALDTLSNRISALAWDKQTYAQDLLDQPQVT